VNPLPVGLYDSDGNGIKSLNGALDVHAVDAHFEAFDSYVDRLSGVASTLAAATVGDGTERTIEVAAGGGLLFSEGEEVDISDGSYENTHPVIISIVGDVLTLDHYIDRAHAIGTPVKVITTNMAVLGSLGAPVSFTSAPSGGKVVHLHRLLISMSHAAAGDLGKFGGIDALINGVAIRTHVDGVYTTFTNWKANSDLVDDMYDVRFDVRSGGGGAYGTSARWTLSNVGATVRLDGVEGDFVEVLVQDDLRGLASFKIKMQGHYGD